jgi:hypothetical protein
MVYSDGIEDRMFLRNPSLKPEKDKRGLQSQIIFSNPDLNFRKRDSIKKEYLKTFNGVYDVIIDSVAYNSTFILGESKTKEFGFETYIDISGLSKGKHLLKIQRDAYTKKDTLRRTISTIPFWYFKD